MQEQGGRDVPRANVLPYDDRHSKGKAFAWKDAYVFRTMQSAWLEAAGTIDAAELTIKAKASYFLVWDTAP
jgi:hypothetical protein